MEYSAQKSTPPMSNGQPPMNYGPPPPPANGIPFGAPTAPLVEGPWSSGLFDCTSDWANCGITLVCPCITFGQVAEIVDQGSTSCVTSGALYALLKYATNLPCLYSCFYRGKMRKQYKLAEDPCNDCLVHFFCEPLALCQEYRELKHRGFDMSLGWKGNVERNQGVAMAAPNAQGGMSR